MEGVGGHAGDGGAVVLVGADEVAHVDQQAVVIVRHGVEELLYAVGVLGDVAVVLGAGPHALGGGVLRNGAGVLRDGGEHEAEGAGGARLARAIAHVVAHDRATENGGDVHLLLQSLHLGGGGLGGCLVEITADGVGVDGHAQAVGLGAELFGVGHLLLVGGGGEVDELNGLEAHIVSLLDHVEVGELARVDVLLEGVGADGDLHGGGVLSWFSNEEIFLYISNGRTHRCAPTA